VWEGGRGGSARWWGHDYVARRATEGRGTLRSCPLGAGVAPVGRAEWTGPGVWGDVPGGPPTYNRPGHLMYSKTLTCTCVGQLMCSKTLTLTEQLHRGTHSPPKLAQQTGPALPRPVATLGLPTDAAHGVLLSPSVRGVEVFHSAVSITSARRRSEWDHFW